MIQTSVADQIIQVINDLCQKFGIVMDWSAENLVPVAEHLGSRIVEWNIAEAIFCIILCGIFFIAGIVSAISGFKLMYSKDYYNDDLCFALILIGILAATGFGVGLSYNIYDLIKCLTFPELKILEYIQSFMQ